MREAELRAARDQAEAASNSKSQFLANMSHELRTPLNAVIGFSEIMKTELLGPIGTETYRGYSHSIHDSARHLLGIINDILDISSIESGSPRLHEGIHEPEQICQSVIGLVAGRADTGAGEAGGQCRSRNRPAVRRRAHAEADADQPGRQRDQVQPEGRKHRDQGDARPGRSCTAASCSRSRTRASASPRTTSRAS